MQLNDIMMDVEEGGKEGECQENTTNLQEEVTNGGNLSNDGHANDCSYQNLYLRDQTSRK